MNTILTRPVSLFSLLEKNISYPSTNEIHSEPVYVYASNDIQNIILGFTQLENNWDGQGACAPSESAIHNALYFIGLVPDVVVALIEKEDVYCTAHGTIIIDIENKSKILSIEIGDHSLGCFLESSDDILSRKDHETFNRYNLSDDLVKIIQLLME